MENKITRKNFLVKTGVVGISLLGASSLIQYCKKEEQKTQQTVQEGPKCDDVTGLQPEEIEQRKNLKYTDITPEAGKQCDNCALYILPEGNNPCGGCNLIKGPVSPKGWCTSWVQKG